MKRALALIAAGTSLGFASSAQAGMEMPDHFFYFGAHASEYFFDIDNSAKGAGPEETTLPGVQLGYRFNPHWSVQAWWERNDFNADNGKFDGTLNMWNASARYHFSGTSVLGFEPYAGLHAGEFTIKVNKENDETIGGFEFGLQNRLRPHWILDIGARPWYSFDNERWDTEAYLALNFIFAGDQSGQDNSAATASQAAPVAATVFGDKDGDGVTDAMDQCPDSPAGATVDERGCEKDSDGDGIVDSLDQCADTPAGAKVDEKGCNQVLEQAVRQTLHIQFANNAAEVQDASMQDIENLANMMKQYPDASMTLVGYTDSVGAAAYNQKLSQQRADAVKQVMIDRFGIDGDRISAVGKGEENPIADNGTAAGRQENRRVEVVLEQK